MIVEQLYTKCLSEAAYYIESNGEAAIIDPLRESTPYLELAEKNGATIRYIFETHFHADFVSGHVELAEKTGASIVYGPTAKPEFDAHIAQDLEEFQLGNVKIRVLHTPGHTEESSTFLLIDENDKETAIFTGDTLFLGDVGRPDLAVKTELTQEQLAGMLFDSLRNKIMTLDDDITIYPAHGAGSACGKNMSSETIGSLGDQKATNYALRPNMTKDEFIKEVTEGILPPPQYFPKNAKLNKSGYASLDGILQRANNPLPIDRFKEEVENGALILDVRNRTEFIEGFIPNSLFIGLDGTFALWVGALIEDIDQKIILIAPEGKEEEAITRLCRVGYDNTLGYLEGGVPTYVKDGGELNSITSESASDLEKINDAQIVDVRKPGEYEADHVEGAMQYPLDYINNDLQKLDKNETYHVHCAGGYRSVIAISLLMQNGYANLINVEGGFQDMKKTSIPTICEKTCSNS